MYNAWADLSGLFRLTDKPRKTFYIIVSKKSMFFKIFICGMGDLARQAPNPVKYAPKLRIVWYWLMQLVCEMQNFLF